MNKIDELLILFDEILKKYNNSNYNRLFNKLNKSEQNVFFNTLQINDADFNAVYNWKNGFDPLLSIEKTCQIFNFDSFMPLATIIKSMESAKKNKRWHESFIPLITDYTGQYILFNNNKNSKGYSRLYLYSASLLTVNPKCYYDSIYKMLETVIEAYRLKIFVYNPDRDILDIEYEKWSILCKEMNKYANFY